jgi:hypothetical protein
VKSAPTTGRGSGKRKRGVDVVEIEDGDRPCQISERNTPSVAGNSESTIEDMRVVDDVNTRHVKQSKKEVQLIYLLEFMCLLIHLLQAVKKNPIHYFYEQVDYGADGSVGNPGDKHFKCYHGNRKVITLTKSMKYNLTSMSVL